MTHARLTLATGIGFLIALQLHAQTEPAEARPLGKSVTIGGRRLQINCNGQGRPAVVLVAGGGAFAIDWALVQPKIAERTRVCSYDRAGLGWSDDGPADETVEQTISDLHALLRGAGEQGPYVLVGASIGGIFIQAYQRAYPEDVAGLVFTNSANRVGFNGKGKGGLIWELSEDELRSGFPLPASAKWPKPVREGAPFDRLPADLQAVRLGFDVRMWEKSDPAKATATSLLSWRKEFRREFEETAANQGPPLGKLPVVVLASGPAATEAQRLTRDNAGARLDFLSSNTIHMVAEGSGHEIHLFQPEMVVEAIGKAVGAIRSHTMLSHQ